MRTEKNQIVFLLFSGILRLLGELAGKAAFASTLRWGRLRRLGKLAYARTIILDHETRVQENQDWSNEFYKSNTTYSTYYPQLRQIRVFYEVRTTEWRQKMPRKRLPEHQVF